MKKILVTILTLAIMALGMLTACEKKAQTPPPAAQPAVTPPPPPAPAPAPAPAPEPAPAPAKPAKK